LVLPRGIPEDLLDTLHPLARGDIYQIPYEDIKIVFRNHSRETRKRGRQSQPIASTSSSSSSIKDELEDMLEYFKSEMLQTLVNANGYLAYQKETRGSREGFGHFLS